MGRKGGVSIFSSDLGFGKAKKERRQIKGRLREKVEKKQEDFLGDGCVCIRSGAGRGVLPCLSYFKDMSC